MNTTATARLLFVSVLGLAACDEDQAAKDEKTLVADLSPTASRNLCEAVFDSSIQQGLSHEFATCALSGLTSESARPGTCEATRNACLAGANDAVLSHAPASCGLGRCSGLTVADVKSCNEAYDKTAVIGVSFDCDSAPDDVEALLDADPPEACEAYFKKCGF